MSLMTGRGTNQMIHNKTENKTFMTDRRRNCETTTLNHGQGVTIALERASDEGHALKVSCAALKMHCAPRALAPLCFDVPYVGGNQHN